MNPSLLTEMCSTAVCGLSTFCCCFNDSKMTARNALQALEKTCFLHHPYLSSIMKSSCKSRSSTEMTLFMINYVNYCLVFYKIKHIWNYVQGFMCIVMWCCAYALWDICKKNVHIIFSARTNIWEIMAWMGVNAMLTGVLAIVMKDNLKASTEPVHFFFSCFLIDMDCSSQKHHE